MEAGMTSAGIETPFRIESTGPFPHPAGRRLLAAGVFKGPFRRFSVRFGDLAASAPRPVAERRTDGEETP
jgi:hypothetical protein